MAETEPLLFMTWNLLISKVRIILASPNGVQDNAIEADNRVRAQHQARGIAEVLAIYMKPFVESADDVVRHAVKFYKALLEDKEYEVPGLGLHLFDPFKNSDGSPRQPVASPKTRTGVTVTLPAAPAIKLSDAEVKSVREMVSSGMMKPDELAKMFNVSLATIIQATRLDL